VIFAEGTLALLAHVVQSAHYHSIVASNTEGRVGTLAQDAQDMRTLLTSVLEVNISCQLVYL
jgi:hypothetical protein